MKRIICSIMLCLMAMCFCACDDFDLFEASDSVQNADKKTIEMKDGYDTLQSLYLQIDDNYTEGKISSIVDDNDLYMETTSEPTLGMTEIYISETEGRLGPGAEPWYEFDTDTIHLTLFKDEERDDKVYVFSKDYYVIDYFMSVNYTFYNSELYVENSIPGYSGGSYASIDERDSIEEALDYALTNDIITE